MKTLTKVKYMKIAMSICGYVTNEQNAETIYELFKATEKKGGELSLKDIAKIQTWIEEKYDTLPLTNK